MIDKKKVVLLGTTLVLLVGCNVFAKSKMNFSSNENGNKRAYLKARYSNAQTVDSGDKFGEKTAKKVKNKNQKKAKLNNLSDEEKAAIKEKFENLTEEEKAALKERKALKKERKVKSETATSNQEV